MDPAGAFRLKAPQADGSSFHTDQEEPTMTDVQKRLQDWGILGPPALEAGADDPPYFHDLNLDQVVAAVTATRAEYGIDTFFKAPLQEPDSVRFRQDVFRDLDRPATLRVIESFCSEMRRMRSAAQAAAQQHYLRPRQRWTHEAACVYCTAVQQLSDGLAASEPRSAGLQAFGDRVTAYLHSPEFTDLRDEALHVKDMLDRVEYTMRLRGGRITVRRYEGAADYSAEVLSTFDRFRQSEPIPDSETARAGPGRRVPDLNHVEAAIVDMVARLHPDPFEAVAEFNSRHDKFVSPFIAAFDRDVQFYLAYLDFIGDLRATGLAFCYPEPGSADDDLYATGSFDVALAARLHHDGSRVVPNDFALSGPERILVVSGPNQGGKTTFARMVGQIHFLGSLGCPVPGRAARLLLFDQIYTHFEREETSANGSGKLEDDLRRAQPILRSASRSSLILINEIFTSTTFDDALFLTRELVDKVTEIGAPCVIVTFIDEIATLNQATVSMVGTVRPDNPAERTYQLVRAAPNGLAYAAALTAKYRLGYDALRQRMAR
jgi:DNA mismatch repair protein MutS